MRKHFTLDQEKVVECAPERASIWLVFNPDAAERRQLVEECQIDEHTLNSALDPDEDPRMVIEDSHVALILNRPCRYQAADNLTFKVASAGIFLFKERLIMVVDEEIPVFDDRKTFSHVSTLAEVMLLILYRKIAHFMSHLKVINMISDELEQKASTSTDNRNLLALFTIGKSLVYFTTAIQANGVLIEKIRHSAAKLGLTQDEVWLIEDILVENNQCAKQAEIYSNIVAGLMDARASMINNNMNQMMKRLTIVMIAVMWPALVSGLFSMNVRLPVPQQTSLFPFFLCLTLAFGPLIGLWLWYRRKVARPNGAK
jgi:magnesium transporter